MTSAIDIQVERWPLERLIPRVTNPRTHSDEQIAQIAASIREFGWTNPILVGPDRLLLAGHGRLLAARKLGMKEVPVIVLGHLTEAQRRALVIADNQLALNAGWSEELLRLELQALQEEDFDLNLIGFNDTELARLLAEQDAAEGLTDEDAVPALQETPSPQLANFGSSAITGCLSATRQTKRMSSGSWPAKRQTFSSSTAPITCPTRDTPNSI